SRRGPKRDGAVTPVGEPMRISSRPVESNGPGTLGPPRPVSPMGVPGAGVALAPGSWGPAADAESPFVPGSPPSGPGDGSGPGAGGGSGDGPGAGGGSGDGPGPGPGPGHPGPDGTRGPSTERATVILAAGTFASRLTGFLRVLTIGYVLGVSSLSDAYNYAN